MKNGQERRDDKQKKGQEMIWGGQGCVCVGRGGGEGETGGGE